MDLAISAQAAQPKSSPMGTTKSATSTDRHVGARVRMRRLMLGMSQETLGAALDVTFQQIQKYEKGTNRIGASRLQQIAHALHVPVSFFFDGAPSVTTKAYDVPAAASPVYLSEFLASDDGIALTKAFMKITDIKLRRLIVDLVQRLAEGEP
jgi:transcriptional regulator with XRE-family HTH domain